MGWIGVVIAGGLFFGSGVYLVGSAMPSKHKASSALRVGASPERVWAVITDHEGMPAWRRGVGRVERVESHPVTGGGVWVEHTRHDKLPIEVLSAQGPGPDGVGRYVTRIVDKGMPFGGTWTIEISADGDGSRVVITEDGFVRSPVFRVIGTLFIGHHATMDAYLTDLGAHLGGGGASPEHLPG